jgi:hypothetical protein
MCSFFDHSPCKASRVTTTESYGRCGLKVQILDKTVVIQDKASRKTRQISGITASHFETQLPSH